MKMKTGASAAGAGREGVGEGKHCSFSLGLKFQLGLATTGIYCPFSWWDEAQWVSSGDPLLGHAPMLVKLLV